MNLFSAVIVLSGMKGEKPCVNYLYFSYAEF